MKLKIPCPTAENTIIQAEREPRKWGKTLASYKSRSGLIIAQPLSEKLLDVVYGN